MPIEMTDSILKMVGNPQNLKPGDRIRNDEPLAIKLQHFPANDQGVYWLLVFTSEEEVKKGAVSSIINRPLKEIFDAAMKWPDCVGCIINPWDKKLGTVTK